MVSICCLDLQAMEQHKKSGKSKQKDALNMSASVLRLAIHDFLVALQNAISCTGNAFCREWCCSCKSGARFGDVFTHANAGAMTVANVMRLRCICTGQPLLVVDLRDLETIFVWHKGIDAGAVSPRFNWLSR
jgi:hypothetical protein